MPYWLEHAFGKNGISLLGRIRPKTNTSDPSHLYYADKKHAQYQVIVKLLGSFRLTALNRHLHRYCIFTELVPETVPQSLHHSCASELHSTLTSLTRRIRLYLHLSAFCISAFVYFLFPLGFILNARSIIFFRPFFSLCNPFCIRKQIFLKDSKSFCLAETIGNFSK